ncbi:hypothetical protein FACS189468_3230 [Spirochaetia bacterium]|nr:hypothetical protein FACS189468_3230 [Spirochaetia bacterium]
MGGEELKRFRVFVAAFLLSAGVIQSIYSQIQELPELQPEAALPVQSDQSVQPAQTVPSLETDENFFAPEDSPAAGPGTSGGSSFLIIFRMVLVLALVAAAIYLVVFFLKRLSRPQSQAQQNPHLKILASTHLGSGRFVHVISLGQRAWLIGAGEGGIDLIAELEDQDAVNAMLLDNSRQNAGTGGLPSFQALLHRLTGGGSPSGSGSDENRLENIRKRRERFKRL